MRSGAARRRRRADIDQPARDAGDRLVQQAIAGEAIQSAANGSASGQVPCPDANDNHQATAAIDDRPGHPAIEAEKVGL